MWIVKLALRRTYTFVVMAVLMLVLGALAIASMPVDIFPYINIPVISVVWTYTGMSPQEMVDRITTISERAMTTTVNDIEHMESTSYNGVSVIRMYFQPNVQPLMAIAQITALAQTILRPLPPGIFPPLIIAYDAASVPILQLGLQSNTLSEQQLYDYGAISSRHLHHFPGAAVSEFRGAGAIYRSRRARYPREGENVAGARARTGAGESQRGH